MRFRCPRRLRRRPCHPNPPRSRSRVNRHLETPPSGSRQWEAQFQPQNPHLHLSHGSAPRRRIARFARSIVPFCRSPTADARAARGHRCLSYAAKLSTRPIGTSALNGSKSIRVQPAGWVATQTRSPLVSPAGARSPPFTLHPDQRSLPRPARQEAKYRVFPSGEMRVPIS